VGFVQSEFSLVAGWKTPKEDFGCLQAVGRTAKGRMKHQEIQLWRQL